MLADIVETAAHLVGIEVAPLRGLFGPEAVAVGGFILILVAFLLAALVVAIPAALALTRLTDWARLNIILRRIVRGDRSVLTEQINNRRH
jgi:hypothetical protein